MTETEYVSLALSKMRNHARSNGQHWWLVAHPTKLTKDKEGNYPVPTLWDCSGSANFRNKPDMGLVLWRDLLEENGPTTVFVQKVKYRWCGRVGKCELYYDIITGRYYDPDHYQQDAQPSYYYQRETF
jgi:twinkle protein